MTKAFFICTLLLLVTQYAASMGSKPRSSDSVVTEKKEDTVAQEKSNVDGDEYKAQLESGKSIKGEGPFVVNAEQLPADARDEVMKLLNTQYRLSQERKQQSEKKAQQIQPEFKQDVLEDEPQLTSEDETFDPELASGIAELLTRMAVEDEDGNQYLDLAELPAELREPVSSYLMRQQQDEEQMQLDDLVKEQIKVEAEENNKPSVPVTPTLIKQHGSQVGGLLGSLIGGAVGGYPAYGYPGGHYGGYGGNYHGGYRPQYGGYPQYGQQYGGYPGGGHHHHHHHGYGYSAYPATLGQSSYGSRPQRPHGVIVSREQLATLLAADPTLAEFVYPLSLNAAAAGPMPGYHFGQPSSYNRRQPKPQQFYQSANPLAAYYQQFLQSQQYQPITSEKFGPAGRFQPQTAIRQQQPRPFGYYPKPSAASALDRYRF
ncbi:keratin, type I cytoskeletal 10-like [Daphnia pulex]|uniref:keratin, type I cytoskeletal 10-like n=1 Tax=Daphnia pulex TaxID=6669 RepID=UPI001EDF5A4F|nr:keratin, type I cytoskeletal 10-like [Daphnia pulex]